MAADLNSYGDNVLDVKNYVLMLQEHINNSKIEEVKKIKSLILPSCNHFIKHEDVSLAL